MQAPLDLPVSPHHQGWSYAQLAVSGLGLLLSMFSAGGLLIFGLVGLLTNNIERAQTNLLFSMVWISLLTAAATIPSLLTSIRSLWGKGPRLPNMGGKLFLFSSALLLVWPLVLWLGSIVANSNQLAWLLLPPLQILAVVIPAWWLIQMASRKISVGSLQRGWGLVNFSIFITNPLAIFLEVVVFAILVLLFAVWASGQPALLQALQRLAQQLATSPSGNPEAILPLIAPMLQNPLVIFTILALMAGLIPMLEELLKPLAMWALVGHRLTPAEGFVAGALCGGVFAILESLFYLSSTPGAGWAVLAVGRAGTALLHITTTSLLGWALASAWQNGSYVRLGLTYLLSSLLHGLWNGLTILTSLSANLKEAPASLQPLYSASKYLPYTLGVLVVALFLLLWNGNRVLSAAQNAGSTPQSSDTIVPAPANPTQHL